MDSKIKPCPECQSKNIFRYKGEIETTTIGGGLLPKLEKGYFAGAKIKPVICSDCGYIRFYSSKNVLLKLEKSKDWEHV